jgi:adenine-specific DNA-methyltransferase
MLLSQQAQTTLFGEAFKPNKLPKTQYLGSKERLVKWIFDNTPKEIENFFDAFSGTSVVGYYFKNKGKRVIVNDFLKFNFHIGKALIENKNITLDDGNIALLLSENKKAGSLIEDIFTDVFFERDQAHFLDTFKANINLLDNEYKKSLALAIMNRALTRKVLLGHFAHLSALRYSKDLKRVKRNPTIARPLKDLFLELVPEYNNAVFDNEKDNKVYCEDTIRLIPKLKNVDLAYFDPPYCGCHPDYQAFYHFLETFVEYWKDKEFINGTRQYFPKKESGFVRKSEIANSFKKLFSASAHIPYWLISYNSKSYPPKETMIDLIEQHKKVKVFEHEYQNHYGGKGSKKGTKEYLFYCYE